MTYHIEHHIIDSKHPLYPHCCDYAHAARNLDNAARFVQRQLMTGLQKEPGKRHELEQKVIDNLVKILPLANEDARNNTIKKLMKDGKPIPAEIPDKYEMLDADHWFISDGLLEAYMKHTDNPDYAHSILTKQSAQQQLRQATRTWDATFKSLASYRENPSKFTGKPGIAGYGKKGGMATSIINNQDAVIRAKQPKKKKKGERTPKFTPGWELKLPATPKRLNLGKCKPEGTLKEVRIVPVHNRFDIQLVLDDGKKRDDMELPPMDRCVGIDLGVGNFAATVNNCGLPCWIYEGGVIKSANQWYNKEMARIQSEQTEGGDEKFHMTEEAHAICLRRNLQIRDYMYKVSTDLVGKCVDNRIDTLIAGRNGDWKRRSDMGRKSNQEFVGIPYELFIGLLEDKCAKAGIRLIVREESYTSKACFATGDYIPTYGEEKPEGGWEFGGYRRPQVTYYRQVDGVLESYRVHPRGLYKVKGKKVFFNSDLNGAANIVRKEWAEAFDSPGHCAPDFSNVVIIKHPDYESRKALRERQLSGQVEGEMSNSKRKRLEKKGRLVAADIDM